MLGGILMDAIAAWWINALLICLTAMLNLITHILLITPDVTSLPQVQALTGRSIWVVDTCFVLVFTAAAALSMIAGSSENTRYSVKDLLPRCVVAFVAAHFSQLFAGKMIEVVNAVVLAITHDDLGGARAFAGLRSQILAGRDAAGDVLFAVVLALLVWLLAASLFGVIVRFAVALLLTSIAPIALACHALPLTDGVARLWWRSYLAMLAVPLGQAFVLFSGRELLLDPGAMLPTIGLPNNGILNLFCVVAMLWATVRVPGLIRSLVSGGGSNGSRAGNVVRVLVIQQLTRGLRVPGVHP